MQPALHRARSRVTCAEAEMARFISRYLTVKFEQAMVGIERTMFYLINKY